MPEKNAKCVQSSAYNDNIILIDGQDAQAESNSLPILGITDDSPSTYVANDVDSLSAYQMVSNYSGDSTDCSRQFLESFYTLPEALRNELIGAFDEQYAILEKEYAKLREQVESLKHDNENLKCANVSLRNSEITTNQKIYIESEELESRNRVLEEARKEAEHIVQELRAELKSSRDSAHKMGAAEKGRLEVERAGLINMIGNHINILSQHCYDTIDESETILAFKELMGSISSCTDHDDISKGREALGALYNKFFTICEKERGALHSKIDALERKRRQLQNDNAHLIDEKSKLRDGIKKLVTEKVELCEASAKTSAYIETLENKITDLENYEVQLDRGKRGKERNVGRFHSLVEEGKVADIAVDRMQILPVDPEHSMETQNIPLDSRERFNMVQSISLDHIPCDQGVTPASYDESCSGVYNEKKSSASNSLGLHIEEISIRDCAIYIESGMAYPETVERKESVLLGAEKENLTEEMTTTKGIINSLKSAMSELESQILSAGLVSLDISDPTTSSLNVLNLCTLQRQEIGGDDCGDEGEYFYDDEFGCNGTSPYGEHLKLSTNLTGIAQNPGSENSLEDDILDLEQEIGIQQDAYLALQSEKDALETDKKDLMIELTDKKQELSYATTKLQDAERTLAQLESALQQFKLCESMLQSEKDNLTAELRTTSETICSLNTRATASERQMQYLEQKMSEQLGVYTALQSAKVELDTKNEDLTTALADSKRDFASVVNNLQASEDLVKRLNDDLKNIRTRLQEKDNVTHRSQNEFREKDEAVTDSQSRLHILQLERDSVNCSDSYAQTEAMPEISRSFSHVGCQHIAALDNAAEDEGVDDQPSKKMKSVSVFTTVNDSGNCGQAITSDDSGNGGSSGRKSLTAYGKILQPSSYLDSASAAIVSGPDNSDEIVVHSTIHSEEKIRHVPIEPIITTSNGRIITLENGLLHVPPRTHKDSLGERRRNTSGAPLLSIRTGMSEDAPSLLPQKDNNYDKLKDLSRGKALGYYSDSSKYLKAFADDELESKSFLLTGKELAGNMEWHLSCNRDNVAIQPKKAIEILQCSTLIININSGVLKCITVGNKLEYEVLEGRVEVDIKRDGKSCTLLLSADKDPQVLNDDNGFEVDKYADSLPDIIANALRAATNQNSLPNVPSMLQGASAYRPTEKNYSLYPT